MVPHLFYVPARTHAEEHAAAGQMIQRGHLFGEHDGVAFGDQRDAGTHLDRRRDRGRHRERYVGVVGIPVLPRQLPATRPGRRPTCRYVGVLGKEHRLEAPSFGGARQLRGSNRVGSGENQHSEIRHLGLSSSGCLRLQQISECRGQGPAGKTGRLGKASRHVTVRTHQDRAARLQPEEIEKSAVARQHPTLSVVLGSCFQPAGRVRKHQKPLAHQVQGRTGAALQPHVRHAVARARAGHVIFNRVFRLGRRAAVVDHRSGLVAVTQFQAPEVSVPA